MFSFWVNRKRPLGSRGPGGEPIGVGELSSPCEGSGNSIHNTIQSMGIVYDTWSTHLRSASGDLVRGWQDVTAQLHDVEVAGDCTIRICLDETTEDAKDESSVLMILVARRPDATRLSPAVNDYSEESCLVNGDDYFACPWTRRKYSVLTSAKEFGRNARAIASTVFILLVATLVIWRYSLNSTLHERYPTPGSSGPKHQSHLLYNNSTKWAKDHHYDHTSWKVRLDDQAVIPAHLYSEQEDRYQNWFRQRYPHLQQIVENHTFLRPSWLGSRNIAVPWDEEFHFAHCVLALRRYWVAKETGKHVCGRDIDHAHMSHCLDSLDAKAFPLGPMNNKPGDVLWWQTKVCYD